MMIVEVNRFVFIKNNQAQRFCRYFRNWNNIPVFIADDDNDTRSALYKDGTSFIIMGGDLAKLCSEELIYNRLWHEVAHLYFKDVWSPWDIRYEFRADLVASAATGRDVSLSRLDIVKKLAPNTEASKLVERRIEHLRSAPNTYTKATLFHMLNSLKPVTVL